MKFLPTALPGVVIIEPRVHTDARGFFLESFRASDFSAAGLPAEFVQENHSRSVPGTVRGLHFQCRHPQGKLVRIVRGAVIDVAVDIRRGSPTFGRWVSVELSAANKRQVYIPPGFAHGFCVPEVESEMVYKCTDYYAADDQHGVQWNDPSLAIPWPVAEPVLSERDLTYLPLDAPRADLPVYSSDGS